MLKKFQFHLCFLLLFSLSSVVGNLADKLSAAPATLATGNAVSELKELASDRLLYEEKRSLSETEDQVFIKMGPIERVNEEQESVQEEPAIATLSNGNFVIAFMSDDPQLEVDCVYIRIFEDSGSSISALEELVSEENESNQNAPTVGALPSGKFIVAWRSDQSSGSYEIYARLYFNDGTPSGSEILISDIENLGSKKEPSIVVLDNGEALVLFARDNSQAYEVYAQLIDIDGNKSGSNLKVHGDTSDNQEYPRGASLPNSDIFIVRTNNDGSKYLVGTVVTKTGATVVPDFTIASGIDKPSICRLTSGDFVVAWYFDSFSSSRIEFHIIAGDGSFVTEEPVIIDQSTSSEFKIFLSTSVTSHIDGGFIIAVYESTTDTIKSYRFNKSLEIAEPPFDHISGDGSAQPALTGIFDNEGFVITWSTSYGGDTTDIAFSIGYPCPDIIEGENGIGPECPCPGEKINDDEGFCYCPLTNSNLDICECYSNQYQIGLECIDCIDNCILCTSEGCETCDTGYSLTSEGCILCSANCASCTSEGCETCDAGYSLTSEGCILCSSNCASCTSEGCDTCDTGYSLTNDGCILCGSNCASCNSEGCQACEEGYMLTTTGCVLCSDNCRSCDENGCLECEESFYLDTDAQCKTDVCTNVENCNYCPNDKCEACETEYSLNYDSQCSLDSCLTIDNCLECEDGSDCTQCNSGYFYYNSGCTVCDSECQKCTHSGCECSLGYYSTPFVCEKCIDYCSECTNGTECTMCESGFELDYTNICNCPINQSVIDGYCVENPIKLYIYDRTNKLSAEFSEDMTTTIDKTTLSCNLTPDSEIITPVVVERSKSVYYIQFKYSFTIPDTTTGIELTFEELEGVSGNKLPKNTYWLPGTKDSIESYKVVEESEELQQLEEVTEEGIAPAATGTMSFSSVVLSLLMSKLSVLWAFISTAQLIYYIPLHNIQLPNALTAFYRTFGSDFYNIPKLLELFDVEIDEGRSSPNHWAEYEFPTTSFAVNCGEILLIGLATLCLLPLFLIAFFVFIGWNKVSKFLWRRILDYKWCFFIRFFLQGFVELIGAALLSAYTTDVTVESVFCTILLVLGFVFPIVSVIFLYKKKEEIKSENEELILTYGSLFEELKIDQGFYGLLYYPIFCIRRLIYVFVLFFGEDYPEAQICINAICSVLVCAYVMWYNPFKEHKLQVIILGSELVVTLNVMLIGLFLFDLGDEGELVIAIFVIVSLVSLSMISFYQMIVTLWIYVKEKCLKKDKKNTNMKIMQKISKKFSSPSHANEEIDLVKSMHVHEEESHVHDEQPPLSS